MPNFKDMTPEQRREFQKRSTLARQAKKTLLNTAEDQNNTSINREESVENERLSLINMQISLSEFLKKVSALKTKKEKVEAIKANDTLPLRIVLQGAFDPAVEWLLPPGDPPYKPNENVDQEHILISRCQKLRYFVRGFYDNLKQTKREEMFIEMLENLDKDDAVLLCNIKEKKLPYPGITLDMVKEALPGLINEQVTS